MRHNLEESLSGSFTFVFLYEIRTIPDEGDKVTMDPGVDAMVLPQVVFWVQKMLKTRNSPGVVEDRKALHGKYAVSSFYSRYPF